MTIYYDAKREIPTEVKKMFPMIDQTMSIIRIGHNGQQYNSLPYWHHPVRVMLRFNWENVTPDVIYGSLFHDLLEDTCITEDDLRAFGYSQNCIDIVLAVTRNKDEETYKDFIGRVRATGNPDIIRLKLADLYENLNNVRFLPPEKKGVAVRYGKSINELHEAYTEYWRARQSSPSPIILSGELDKDEVQKWIGQTPTFL
jgi:guanosine-3',5'-bis(diphosphate) 3'-pyrophosphohydrolase